MHDLMFYSDPEWRDKHHGARVCSFIHEAGGRSRAEKEIPNMDKSSRFLCMKTVVFTEKQKRLET